MQYRSGITVEIVHVSGRTRGKVMLYALSTCVWCKKTKELLASLGVDHSYVFVDLLPEKEMEETMNQVLRFNPKGSFPTLVIDERRCIVGFREAEIREALA
ncbi:MAG: glutaredoxin family protein [Methanomicrobiales archaeon]|nr:glutaredoxin family protein [Methanomicrobiales archaeon]